MNNKLRLFNELVEEGSLAFSDEIFGLIDDELTEDDLDPDLEAVLATEELRGAARRR